MNRIAPFVGVMIASVLSIACRPESAVSPRAAVTNVRVNLGAAFPFHEEPSIAVDQTGRIFIAWKDTSIPQTANRDAFARSLDGGLTWSPPVEIERLSADRAQSDPWLLAGPSGVLIYAQQHVCSIALVTSRDAGTTWSRPVSVHDRPGCADKESMASDGRANVYLVYHDIEDSSASIVLTMSRDGGISWSPTTVVARTAGEVYLAPSVAATPDGHVYVAWWSLPDDNLKVASSRDFGTTWGAARRVNPVPGSLPAARVGSSQSSYSLFPPFPSLAVSTAGAVFVAWPDYTTDNWDVLSSRSDDDGATWSAPTRISDESVGNQWMVSLGIDSRDVLHAAWFDSRSNNTDVRYATSSDRGQTWSASFRVTTEATPGAFNRLGDYLGLAVARDGTAHLSWTDVRGGDMNIYYASVPPATR